MPSDKLLILDLDETLIYAVKEPLPEREADFRAGSYHVYRRPGLSAFLETCFVTFPRVAVWTPASSSYAVQIIRQTFPDEGKGLLFLWSGARCTQYFDAESYTYAEGKNLRKVYRKFKFPLSAIVMVDDSPEKLTRHYGNLIRVTPFLGDPEDDELPALTRYLTYLSDVESIRTLEKRRWRERL